MNDYIKVGHMKPNFTPLVLLLGMLILSCLHGCVQHPAEQPAKSTEFYGLPNGTPNLVTHQNQPASLYASSSSCTIANDALAPQNYRADKPLEIPVTQPAQSSLVDQLYGRELPLSPGDLLQINLENGEGFTGRYEIGSNGYLQFPMLTPILAQGLGAKELAEKIELALVRAEIFRPGTIAIDVQILQLAEIEVSVSGAVFEAGRVLINDKIPAQMMKERTAAIGDYTPSRMLSEALRAASGVRPDAKLDQIKLIRNGWQVEVDMSGVLTGRPVKDLALVAGDQIIVPSSGCFQSNLVRPSQITPKGFRVFMSNLIEPSLSNANGGVGSYASSLPYGSRLLQAAVSANCIGGKQWTNASRKVVLATKNPLSGEMQVVERSVEQIMRSPQVADVNPYVMPNDAVACYDSNISNIRDVARSLVEIVAPFKLF